MPIFIYGFSLLCALLFPAIKLPDSKIAKEERLKLWPKLSKDFAEKGLKTNSPIYIRIFKLENDLEIWVKSGKKYQFFKTYNICYFSGGLGTKTRSGDGKSPEGFYTLIPKQLAPVSNYYLAINIGYPNKLEIARGYTGDAIMIHGHCASIDCYAMSNDGIAEIYTLVYNAFQNGQKKINLDIFPFRMDQKQMEFYAKAPSFAFWKNLKTGYDLFEKKLIPTDAEIQRNFYFFKN